jgi:hypothetical protein
MGMAKGLVFSKSVLQGIPHIAVLARRSMQHSSEQALDI